MVIVALGVFDCINNNQIKKLRVLLGDKKEKVKFINIHEETIAKLDLPKTKDIYVAETSSVVELKRIQNKDTVILVKPISEHEKLTTLLYRRIKSTLDKSKWDEI